MGKIRLAKRPGAGWTVVLTLLALMLAAGCGAAGDHAGGSKDTAGSAAASGNGSTDSAGSKGGQSGANAPASGTVELTISAAASLTDAMKEIGDAYAKKAPNVKLSFNLGGSGTLEKQIMQGAPADLFFSASEKNMDELVDAGLVEPSEKIDLLGNELVVVVPAAGGPALSAEQDLKGPDVKRIAVGIPESVPAGTYAKEALQSEGLWDSLQDKIVQAKDVRQVLNFVETGNADAGFVYRTDAMTSDKVKTAFAAKPGSYKPVTYPAGVLKGTKHAAEAQAFYAYLQSPEAKAVFGKYGFTAPQGDGSDHAA